MTTTSQSELTQPLKMRPARGMSTLYPMVPTLWPILEKSQKILNKKQTLRIGENVSLLNSETKEVNLRFVSSSAPTLRSALHFWKYYQVLKGFKIAEDFLFRVIRNCFYPPGKRKRSENRHCWWSPPKKNHFLRTWNDQYDDFHREVAFIRENCLLDYSYIDNCLHLATPDKTPIWPPGICGAAW